MDRPIRGLGRGSSEVGAKRRLAIDLCSQWTVSNFSWNYSLGANNRRMVQENCGSSTCAMGDWPWARRLHVTSRAFAGRRGLERLEGTRESRSMAAIFKGYSNFDDCCGPLKFGTHMFRHILSLTFHLHFWLFFLWWREAPLVEFTMTVPPSQPADTTGRAIELTKKKPKW